MRIYADLELEENDLGSRFMDTFIKRGLTKKELLADVRYEEGEDEYDIAEGLGISLFEARDLIYEFYQKFPLFLKSNLPEKH